MAQRKLVCLKESSYIVKAPVMSALLSAADYSLRRPPSFGQYHGTTSNADWVRLKPDTTS
jgi:hypothetical protein